LFAADALNTIILWFGGEKSCKYIFVNGSYATIIN